MNKIIYKHPGVTISEFTELPLGRAMNSEIAQQHVRARLTLHHWSVHYTWG